MRFPLRRIQRTPLLDMVCDDRGGNSALPLALNGIAGMHATAIHELRVSGFIFVCSLLTSGVRAMRMVESRPDLLYCTLPLRLFHRCGLQWLDSNDSPLPVSNSASRRHSSAVKRPRRSVAVCSNSTSLVQTLVQTGESVVVSSLLVTFTTEASLLPKAVAEDGPGWTHLDPCR